LTDFFDVVLRQRACRQFSTEPVDDALIERCIEAATHAPSAENRQPWEFVVVREPERRAAIGALTRDAWRGGGRAHSVERLPPKLLEEVDAGAEGGVANAPVLVIVCGNGETGMPVTLPSSVYPAIQNLLLAASALGLGSALTTLALLQEDELRTLLALPPAVRPMAIVPLGWPAAPLGRPRRLPVRVRTHRETFGQPW